MVSRMERVSDIVWRKIDDNIVLIKQNGTELITLNSTAAYIWELCNGEMDARDITMELQEQFSVNFEEINNDVINTLKKLKAMGFLKIPDNKIITNAELRYL